MPISVEAASHAWPGHSTTSLSGAQAQAGPEDSQQFLPAAGHPRQAENDTEPVACPTQGPNFFLERTQQLDIGAIAWCQGVDNRNIRLNGAQQLMHISPLTDTELQHLDVYLCGREQRSPGPPGPRVCTIDQIDQADLGSISTFSTARGSPISVLYDTWIGVDVIAHCQQLSQNAFCDSLPPATSNRNHQRFFASQEEPG